MERITFKVKGWEVEPDPVFNPHHTNVFSTYFDGIGDRSRFLHRWLRANTGGTAKEIEILS